MRHHHPVIETDVSGDAGPSGAPDPSGAEEPVAVEEPVAPAARGYQESGHAMPPQAPASRPPKPAPPRVKPHAPSPHDIAELSGAFAMTANVHDPEPEAEPAYQPPRPHHLSHPDPDHDDTVTERGLRGLVGGGASQVSVAAALRARDAARPTDADLAAAEEELVIVRRGWVPREELPRPGRR
jgi:hypothetical protein